MPARPRSSLATLLSDPYLKPYLPQLAQRNAAARSMEKRLTQGARSLADFASGHEHFGLHRDGVGWVFREWLPNASGVCLIGTFSDWGEADEFRLAAADEPGVWQLRLPADAIRHGDLYRLRVHWPGGSGERMPAFARRVVQDESTNIFAAQVWCPDPPYTWQHAAPAPLGSRPLLVYEAHVGIAQEHGRVGTYAEFAEETLPRIADAGYNAVQLMAVMEHPYYGSFGYQVSSFFAASSRFGTPEELKGLVDAAHGAGLHVIIDLIHSHAVKNETEGLSHQDGTPYQYFHEGARGQHPVWDSRCFDYTKPEVLHLLLSNCRFWLDEYRVDGFRFDGITSMLYSHHGLGTVFTGYDQYFDDCVETEALAYLALANTLIHTVNPHAVTIAEDVSGMPGLAAPVDQGGCGFDYRLAMGVPDCWFELVREVRDEDWDLHRLWHELTNRRSDERTISYVECHDQAIVGGKTFLFELLDARMYSSMHVNHHGPTLDRGIALHKMARLATVMAAGHGYLNFMGNEFGHPEWVDFPREGNNWSHHYARRQWSLRDDPALKYAALARFDHAMLALVHDQAAFGTQPPRLLRISEQDSTLAFERVGLFVVLNFHPNQSFADYAIEVPPGTYRLVLDTDEDVFGGQGRLSPQQEYVTQPLTRGTELHHCIKVYAPSRTALVLRRAEA